MCYINVRVLDTTAGTRGIYYIKQLECCIPLQGPGVVCYLNVRVLDTTAGTRGI